MKLAHLVISGTTVSVEESRPIPAGITGATVSLEFTDPVWQGLTKTLCFRGAEHRDVLGVEDSAVIPWETVTQPGRQLLVGVYGTDAEGKVAVPTLWAELGFTQLSADPTGDPSADPSLPVWAQLQEEAAEALAIAKGRAKGYVFDTVEDLDTWLMEEAHTQELAVGDNFYIRALDVPDYWWDGAQKQPLETQKVELSGYVKDTDYATPEKAGVVRVGYTTLGLYVIGDGVLGIYGARKADIDKKDSPNRPITTDLLDYAVKLGVTANTIALTDEEKAAALAWLGVTEAIEKATGGA